MNIKNWDYTKLGKYKTKEEDKVSIMKIQIKIQICFKNTKLWES